MNMNYLFNTHVIDNTKVKIVEANLEKVKELITLIKSHFKVKEVEIRQGSVNEPFGYNIHVCGTSGSEVYFRVESSGVNFDNKGILQVDDEQLVIKVVEHCNKYFVRLP